MKAKYSLESTNKEIVIVEFEKICNQVGAVGLLDVKQDSPLVHAVDTVLQHGLKDHVRGYWSLVRSLTHPTTLKSLEAFVKYISSSQQKGIAWTFYTLEEGSLEYYLSSLLQDPKTLQQHYMEQSLLRDKSLSTRVVATISALRSEAAAIQMSMESSLVSEASLDQVTALASPVDSGVALVDSDSFTSDFEKSEEYTRKQSFNGGQSYKPILGSSVTTDVSTSSDNTLADSDQHNANTIQQQENSKAKPGIIAQNGSYDGVRRRQRKKKKADPGKRVSFHQDSNDDPESLYALGSTNINKFYVEGRYSWAGEGDSFFMKGAQNFRQVKSEVYETKGLSSSISIFESEMGIEADCDNSSSSTLDEAKHNIEMVCEKLTNVVKQSLGLKSKERVEGVQSVNAKTPVMAERGVPEGQEDPSGLTEYERLCHRSMSAVTSDSEWSLDTAEKLAKKHSTPYLNSGPQKTPTHHPNWPARVLHEAPSKTSLVKRFLRSIPTKKPFKKEKPVKKCNLYIKGVKPSPELNEDLLKDLKKEIEQNIPKTETEDDEMVTCEMKDKLRKTVLMDKTEEVYKVYRVASTEGVPLLAVLTDVALYMVGLNSDNSYIRHHYINYHTLDTVVIGPEYQTVMLVTVDHSVTVTVISALGQALVSHMISHLAVAVCRVTHSHLSVCLLSLSNMQSLYRAILTQTSVNKDEELVYYRYIRVEDSHLTGGYGALGPSKSGHLMYRPHSHSPWLPGYILLKCGVLYVFGDAKQQRAKHVLSFHKGYFGGCRRVPNSSRPHTFEVLPFSQRGLYGTFQFAAADDYEASDWLQIFIQTSYTMCQSGRSIEEPLTGCGLLVTSRHLLTLDFPDKVLSCARLQDITTIRTTTTCCILETSCREVQENGGDWILYFLTEKTISEFLDVMYRLRPELKQVTVDWWECEALRSHCLRTSQLVTSAWEPLLQPPPTTAPAVTY